MKYHITRRLLDEFKWILEDCHDGIFSQYVILVEKNIFWTFELVSYLSYEKWCSIPKKWREKLKEQIDCH